MCRRQLYSPFGKQDKLIFRSVTSLRPGDTCMCQRTRLPVLLITMACYLFSTKSSWPETLTDNWLLTEPLKSNVWEIHLRYDNFHLLISSCWCIYAPLNWVSIGSGNGLSPVWCQAITWTNADFLSTGPLGTNFSEIQIKMQNLLINENAFENVVCKMVAILLRWRWVNKMHLKI